MIYGVLAYLLWGLFPAFFPLLEPAGAVEILAHRIIWAAALMALVLGVTRGWGELRGAGRTTWLRMGAAGLLIAANWLIYIVAVNSGHVADAALGYFINPLVSVLLGVFILGERLRRLQLIAVLLAGVAVLWLTFVGGQPPVLALGLALTFGFYGLLKKQIPVSGAAGLAAETLVLAPLALGYLGWLEATGRGTALSNGPGHLALLVLSGVITVIPLLLFARATKVITLSTIGMLQYLTPTMQMLWALFVVNEHVSPQRWVGFVLIWVAVAVFLTDATRTRRAATPRRGPSAG
ncbi:MULTISPECIES: EamA family transporter RarD [unclassified Corynebacterium]|uniref:EamA family transporter RarD n=1 Tax=unclassified Corynebacterium TaxID=2624378 RepID=UPI0029CA69E1|nr:MULTISPECIES: EamA family transporter RarD [unclassified Corynebacterium]WPF65410.1 EamA family transporter RarD [Corynebacterium sp. 22KM0430]WPF67905.1 EamA family transporter RarD [Corynebacterium sp. 21KM1197]